MTLLKSIIHWLVKAGNLKIPGEPIIHPANEPSLGCSLLIYRSIMDFSTVIIQPMGCNGFYMAPDRTFRVKDFCTCSGEEKI